MIALLKKLAKEEDGITYMPVSGTLYVLDLHGDMNTPKKAVEIAKRNGCKTVRFAMFRPGVGAYLRYAERHDNVKLQMMGELWELTLKS